jgi:hypothetical protein
VRTCSFCKLPFWKFHLQAVVLAVLPPPRDSHFLGFFFDVLHRIGKEIIVLVSGRGKRKLKVDKGIFHMRGYPVLAGFIARHVFSTLRTF